MYFSSQDVFISMLSFLSINYKIETFGCSTRVWTFLRCNLQVHFLHTAFLVLNLLNHWVNLGELRIWNLPKTFGLASFRQKITLNSLKSRNSFPRSVSIFKGAMTPFVSIENFRLKFSNLSFAVSRSQWVTSTWGGKWLFMFGSMFQRSLPIELKRSEGENSYQATIPEHPKCKMD